MNTQRVELVIPSYNRLPILRRTFCEVRRLYPDLPICLGLQGEISNAAQQYQEDDAKLVRIMTFDEPSTTKTLNACISSSTADIVLLLDDDAVPCAGWLESHLRAFADDSELVYTAGREIRVVGSRSSFSEWVRIMVEWFCGMFLHSSRKLDGRVVGWYFRSGLLLANFDRPGTCEINAPRECNMGIRRSAFQAIGGFNEAFRGNAWGFGLDFGLRLMKQARYGKYLGDALALHYETPSGGSRECATSKWFQDFLHNQKLVIGNVGPYAWLGAVPRILKHVIRLCRER